MPVSRRFLLFFSILHIFGKNAISFSRLIDKDMGDSPYQLSILNHRAAAHPLQNTICFFQQLFICNLQDKIFVIFVVFVNLPNSAE